MVGGGVRKQKEETEGHGRSQGLLHSTRPRPFPPPPLSLTRFLLPLYSLCGHRISGSPFFPLKSDEIGRMSRMLTTFRYKSRLWLIVLNPTDNHTGNISIVSPSCHSLYLLILHLSFPYPVTFYLFLTLFVCCVCFSS